MSSNDYQSTSDQCGICSGYLSSVIFRKKRNKFCGLYFRRVVILGRLLLSGFANTCDIFKLSLLSEVRFFRGVVTFRILRYSKKLFLDQLNDWLNRKLVSGEVLKLLLSVAKKEFNSRHYSILHVFAFRQIKI